MIENLAEPLRSEVSVIINQQSLSIKPKSKKRKKENLFRFEEVKDYQHYIIRAIDVIGSFIGLLLLMPVLVLTAISVGLTSGFPVFFRQERLGKNGKKFCIIKFRTMRKNAEEILRSHETLYYEYLANDFKLPPDKDPRIIPLGQFLRKTSIDELPQLFNVLKGDMSLVGPRPIVPEELNKYGEYSKEFLTVKPGMTGLWQVSGRSDVGYPDRTYLDLIYVQTRSPWLNMKILCKTPFVVFKRSGAH